MAMHRAVGLLDRKRRLRWIEFDRRMFKQHFLLKFDPENSFACLSVRDTPEELSHLAVELAKYLLAARQRNTADEMKPIAS